MMNTIQRLLFSCMSMGLFLAGVSSCQPSNPHSESNPSRPARPVALTFADAPVRLGDYWYQGKAEVNSFELSQNRYSDLHPGEVVLVFVTEDFLTDKQVKNESYQSDRSAKVLKMNKLQRFVTGIYDYAIMTSVFTPVDVGKFPYTLKVTNTSQDWCGQTYQQVNFRDDHYQTQLFSYFEREGDQQGEVPLAALEDEIFNRIRMNPESLPTGVTTMLPSAMFCRLMHVPFTVQPATASLGPYSGNQFDGEELRAYRVEFPQLNRTLEIVFEGKEPYRIAGWTDSYPSLVDGQPRTTIARRKQTLLNAYWQHHNREDGNLRQQLELNR